MGISFRRSSKELAKRIETNVALYAIHEDSTSVELPDIGVPKATIIDDVTVRFEP